MKKIILSLIFFPFVLGLNAQVDINTTDNSRLLNQPKINAKLVSPSNPSLYQKAFESKGWIYSYGFVANLGILELTDQYNIVNSAQILFPDSTICTVFGNEKSYQEVHGYGFAIDPYSGSYDGETFTNSEIMPTPPNPTHPYRLDTIFLQGLYFEGTKVSPNPDTLRLHICYIEPYKQKYEDYRILHYVSDVNRDTHLLVPAVKVINSTPERGSNVMPTAAKAITIDYVLERNFTKDTIVDGEKKLYYSNYIIPLTYNGATIDGYEIPAGGAIAVMVHFVPGYEYEFGDTLHYGEEDPTKPGYYADGYPIYVNNEFRIRHIYREISDVIVQKAFSDPFGFNTTIFEFSPLHYQMQGNWRDSCYDVNTSFIPFMVFHISVDEEIWDTIDFDIAQINDIVNEIYPNPANDNITIDLKNNKPATIRLYDILGQNVKSAISNDMQTKINVSDLKRGIYVIKVDQNGKTFTSKIIKH